MWDPYAALQHTKLPNGLSVYLGTWDRPWVKMKMIVHAGAKDDPSGKHGVAHFLEHLLCENADGWTRERVSDRLDEIGGSANFGATSYSATEYQCGVPLEGDNLAFALDLFGKMLVTCTIKYFVERERQVILNEYGERFPTSLLAEILTKRRGLFFGDTRLGRYLSPLGDLEGISIIAGEDIQEFYDRCYTPANMSIVAVGGIELEAFVSALQNSPFGAEKPGGRISLPSPMTEIQKPAELRLDKSAAELTMQKVQQSAIELHMAFPGMTNKRAIARAAHTLSSTFHREIREKRGWTYGFGVNYQRFPEAYEFSIGTKFPWEHLGVMEDAIDECISIAIERTDVIERSIKSSANYKLLDPGGLKVVNDSSDDLVEQGYITSLADEMRLAASVTVDQVQHILRQLGREQRLTITLRP